MMTQLHSVTIDDQSFVVSETEVGAIREQILSAAREGAGFVTFISGPRTTEVLVTRMRRVRIDHFPEDAPEARWADDERVPFDWEL